jgi:hypothetical protein
MGLLNFIIDNAHFMGNYFHFLYCCFLKGY